MTSINEADINDESDKRTNDAPLKIYNTANRGHRLCVVPRHAKHGIGVNESNGTIDRAAVTIHDKTRAASHNAGGAFDEARKTDGIPSGTSKTGAEAKGKLALKTNEYSTGSILAAGICGLAVGLFLGRRSK